jgi:hypothetical protein
MADEPSQYFWDELEEINPDAVIFDNLDHCIVGYGSQYTKNTSLIYDYDKMIEHFMFNDGMSYEDADEYVNFNIVGLWAGDSTPIIMRGA